MSKKYAIGLDIGGTNVRAALISQNGEIIRKIKEPSGENTPATMLSMINDLFIEGVAGIGIGIAGQVDRQKNVVIHSPNLHVIEGINFAESLGNQFSVPVFIENDANAAAFGEKWMGAGKRFSNFVLLTLGTGIGGGIIYEDKLVNVSAEIGHMSIIAEGEKCSCGSFGCLEQYAAAKAMKVRVIASLEKGTESLLRQCCDGGSFYKLTAEDIYKFALEGDNLSRETLRDAGRYLGVGLANIINILSPEAIILTGGLIGAWNIYVQEAIKEASKRAFKALYDKVKIIPSMLGDDAGIIGSARLVFQKIIT